MYKIDISERTLHFKQPAGTAARGQARLVGFIPRDTVIISPLHRMNCRE